MSYLIERLEALSEQSNEIDVLVEIALFEPNTFDKAIRSNIAGTKVIYTSQSGAERTHLAQDWSHPLTKDITIAALRAPNKEI